MKKLVTCIALFSLQIHAPVPKAVAEKPFQEWEFTMYTGGDSFKNPQFNYLRCSDLFKNMVLNNLEEEKKQQVFPALIPALNLAAKVCYDTQASVTLPADINSPEMYGKLNLISDNFEQLLLLIKHHYGNQPQINTIFANMFLYNFAKVDEQNPENSDKLLHLGALKLAEIQGRVDKKIAEEEVLAFTQKKIQLEMMQAQNQIIQLNSLYNAEKVQMTISTVNNGLLSLDRIQKVDSKSLPAIVKEATEVLEYAKIGLISATSILPQLQNSMNLLNQTNLSLFVSMTQWSLKTIGNTIEKLKIKPEFSTITSKFDEILNIIQGFNQELGKFFEFMKEKIQNIENSRNIEAQAPGKNPAKAPAAKASLPDPDEE